MTNAIVATADRYQRTPPSEEALELIRAARGGDLAAFETLVARHERRVVRIAYQMVGNLDDAQDVAQEVFIRLWKYLAKMRDEAKFSTWLYRLVVNSSYDLLNRRKADYDHVSIDDPFGHPVDLADDDAIPLDRSAAASELKEKVLEALGRLTPSERTVFVLKDIEGLEVKEIAAIHESSRITVRRHLSNARSKMRTVLTELYPGFAKKTLPTEEMP